MYLISTEKSQKTNKITKINIWVGKNNNTKINYDDDYDFKNNFCC